MTGIADKALAQLSDTGLSQEVVIQASDDPNGRLAFPTASQELSVAEDFSPGNEISTSTIFTVERRQGTGGTVKVGLNNF